jgi:acetyl esterase/lipase
MKSTNCLFLSFVVAVLGLANGAGAAGQEPLVKQDVVYGRKFGMALTMNVQGPKKADANGAGIVLVISGGWFSNHELYYTYFQQFVQGFVQRGYTVFVTFHGSQPRYVIPEAVADINRAVRFIRHHAKEYGVDPERIGICGGSAGGHLSLMLGTAGGKGDAKAADAVDQASSKVQAVACFFPPTDFLNYGGKDKYAFASDGLLTSLRTAVDFHELSDKTKLFERVTDQAKINEQIKKISPITHVTAESAPTLIIHGDADKIVPIEQAELFLARLKSANVPAELIVKKGAGHGWPGMDKDIPSLTDWFDKYLKAKK